MLRRVLGGGILMESKADSDRPASSSALAVAWLLLIRALLAMTAAAQVSPFSTAQFDEDSELGDMTIGGPPVPLSMSPVAEMWMGSRVFIGAVGWLKGETG